MGAPISLLGNARGFARDFARDRMPAGYLWDIVDFVPTVIDAQLTGRGGWRWGSDVSAYGDFETGILATFPTQEQLLGQTTGGHLYAVDQTSPYALTDRGVVPRARQNPIQYFDRVVHFDTTGAQVPLLISASGPPAPMDAAAPKAPLGTTWGEYVVVAAPPGQENTIFFSKPNDPAAIWDVNSFWHTSLPITAVASLRSMILVFHAGSTERIRGAIPPHTGGTLPEGDLVLEPIFGHVGTNDPKSIAYWNEYLLFADEHGVHQTDGAITRNLVAQGGIGHYWRNLFGDKTSVCGAVFLDYYIVTINRTSGPATLVCDLARRQWFRFTNFPALCYVASGGSLGMERIWAGFAGMQRLGRVGPCFFPVLDVALMQDDNGVTILPQFETPWYRLGQEGRKRIRFFYLSYDARLSTATHAVPDPTAGQDPPLPELPASALTALAPVLDVGLVRSPQETAYTAIGNLPASPPTDPYTRYRLLVGKFPYGVAFRVRQTTATSALRIFELGVEAQAAERSRV